MRRAVLVASVIAASSGLSLSACSSEHPTYYGPADQLPGWNPPDPAKPDAGGGGSDSGMTGEAGGEGGVNCATAPKFADIYTLVKGPWACSGSIQAPGCHGTTNTPAIDISSAGTCYTSLQNGKTNTGSIPMIVPGDTSPNKSGLYSCLTNSNHVTQMPYPPGTLGMTDVQTVATWIQCGSMNN